MKAIALGGRQAPVVLVQPRQFLGQLADFLHQLLRARQRQARRDAHQGFAGAVEMPAEIIGHHMFAEVLLHRAVGQPVEGVRDAQAVAVQRFEFDQAQPVQFGQAADALGLRQRIRFHHLLQAPVAQAADRHQQQARMRHQRLFLHQGERVGMRRDVGRAAQYVFHGDAGGLADQGQARQRHIVLAKHALDARFAHGDALGQYLVRDAGGAQLGAQHAQNQFR